MKKGGTEFTWIIACNENTRRQEEQGIEENGNSNCAESCWELAIDYIHVSKDLSEYKTV